MKIYYNPKLKPLARKLRNNSTLAEILLWEEIKSDKMLGYCFLRQKPIGNFIVDFFCNKLKLVIEIDGDSHNEESFQKDMTRQHWLESIGLTVLRFDDIEVKKDMNNVLMSIEGWVRDYEESKGIFRE
ncbi:endonuclease domain-containing protein [Rhodohalobacter mucosus]|uniref:DNA methylase n=1 Tax=Rhodohalobacter mucosus TaxID=2079485 RepID=A0A316TMX7_9BACT|nr:endonuclease domain-containing protein [Rhodohalobacter mucosus]PWN05128.1 DNA methylase [Rhodohalobacter mucosus]